MKTMKSKFYSLALAAGMLTLTACSDDNTNDSNNDKGNGIENGSTLKGTITEDVTLKAGNTYKLSGEYIVEAGATLNIEEGVKIISVYDNIVDYILVKQGAKINAVGTPDKPIVMTSEKEEPGAWGGIHICGKAHTNAEGGKGSSEIGGAVYGGNDDADIVMTSEKEEPGAWGGIHICGKAHTNAEGGKGSSEIGGAVYGGNDDADNSGTLQYIRLEYTGFAFDEEHEANGISFYGVGSGTIVDHCEAYKGSDDGFEFFGGSVNVSNMVVVSCSDDSFDWTEGWNGKGTDLVAYQEAKATLGYDCDCLIEADNNMVVVSCSDDSFDWTEGWNGKGTDLVAYQEAKATLGYDCDCLIEADNNENDNAATPVSHPVLKNLILAGNGESKQGIRLRRGTQADIDNAKVCGKGQPLVVESALTNAALKNGTSKLTNMTVTAALKSDGDYTNDDFTAVTSNKVDATLSYASFDAIKAACDWMKGNWIK